MTFSPLTTDTRAFLRHLGNDGLIAHIAAAVDLLRERGVEIGPVLVDEIIEAEVERAARQPGGLDAHPLLEGII